MTALNSNVSLIALGLAEVREGSNITAGGVAKMAEGIVKFWATPMRWSYGKGDDEVSGVSSLSAMFKPRRHEDGSVDSKFIPAMYRAVADTFLTEGEFATAEKVQFKRAWQVSAGLAAGVDVKFIDTSTVVAGRVVKLRAIEVPASAAFELYDEAGVPTEAGKVFQADVVRYNKRAGKKMSDAEVIAAAKATPVECIGGKFDGLQVPSVSAISERLAVHAIRADLMPAKQTRDSSLSAEKFGESADFVIKCLKMLTERDESEFAPSNALNEKLRGMMDLLSAYLSGAGADAGADAGE